MSERICRLLSARSDRPVLIGDELVPWTAGESTTAVYTCLLTMENAGPDSRFAHPHFCTRARQCWDDSGE